MNFMFKEEFKIAYESSDTLLSLLSPIAEGMINSSQAISIIERLLDCSINVIPVEFPMSEASYGAKMKTEISTNCKKVATIELNTLHSSVFQRFSLFHELGHLMTDPSLFNTSNGFILSTHIDYNVTSIKDVSDSFLLHEQIANIFALRVLMPYDIFYKKLDELNDLKKIANFFGLTKDAVLSRIMLVA